MKKSLKPVELFLAAGLIATVTACGGAPTTEGGEDGAGTPTEMNENAPDDDEEESEEEGGEGGEGGEG